MLRRDGSAGPWLRGRAAALFLGTSFRFHHGDFDLLRRAVVLERSEDVLFGDRLNGDEVARADAVEDPGNLLVAECDERFLQGGWLPPRDS